VIIKIARWLARPQIGKQKFGEHYDIIVSGKISLLEESVGRGKLDHGILMINGFEIAEYQDEEHKKIADAINQITGESE